VTDSRRHIPGVDTLIASPAVAPLLDQFSQDRVTTHLKRAVETVRERIAAGDAPEAPADPASYAELARLSIAAEEVPSLRPAINATGVVLHTNMGRAPLATDALRAMETVGTGYSNLELDLESGRRGSRYTHCADLLEELTGAEDALVVNNCAAALVLAVNALAAGRGVVVSRGELVEIGGGFRIPEILGQAGARLMEVGSTNRTRLADYRKALDGGEAAAILKVHRSNFRISGFTEEASVAELAGLAEEAGVPLIHDIGSGLLLAPAVLGLPDEPTPLASLHDGADVAVFSGDKLLGGPQAGLVVGSVAAVAAMRGNPLCRALRVDKATLAALEATLRLYREPDRALREIPVLRMLSTSAEVLETRAGRMARDEAFASMDVEAAPGRSAVGGGTFPGVEIPSWTLRVTPSGCTVDELASRLRLGDPAVVGRREEGALVLDLRTVDPGDDEVLARRLVDALAPRTS